MTDPTTAALPPTGTRERTIIVRPGARFAHRFTTSFAPKWTTIACTCGWWTRLPRGCTTTQRHGCITSHLTEARAAEAIYRAPNQPQPVPPSKGGIIGEKMDRIIQRDDDEQGAAS